MNNISTVDTVIKDNLQKLTSVEAEVKGPFEASNGKNYYVVSFEAVPDDGFSGQSRLYKKVFFEDSHSLQFKRAAAAAESGKPLKIKAARLTFPVEPHYILDTDGERQTKQDGTPRIANSIVLFLLEDENWKTQLKAQKDRITRDNAWVVSAEDEEETDAEETKAAAAQKPAGKPAGKK